MVESRRVGINRRVVGSPDLSGWSHFNSIEIRTFSPILFLLQTQRVTLHGVGGECRELRILPGSQFEPELFVQAEAKRLMQGKLSARSDREDFLAPILL